MAPGRRAQLLKILDHTGIDFMQNNGRMITIKKFVGEIESVHAEQEQSNDKRRKSAAVRVARRFQLKYSCFFRVFMPLLCMLPTAAFNAACGGVRVIRALLTGPDSETRHISYKVLVDGIVSEIVAANNGSGNSSSTVRKNRVHQVVGIDHKSYSL